MTTAVTQISPATHRIAICCLCLFVAAGCGGGSSAPVNTSGLVQPASLNTSVQFASGPIQSACSKLKRRNLNAGKCGCIQVAANSTLSETEQRRGALFFDDPEMLQRMKLSDTPANERFWDTWARFAETAEALCSSR